MSFHFSQNLDQKQSLNQSQILSLKLLAMNSYELENYMHEMQLENPFVQIEDEENDEKLPDIRMPDSCHDSWISRKTNEKAESWEVYTAAEEKQDRYHFFAEQIGQQLTEKQDQILRYMTEMMDDSGFIAAEDDTIAALLHCREDEIHAVRERIQQADPVGCGSKNIRDCIYAQLKHRQLPLDQLSLCKQLLDHHLQNIAEGKMGKIAKTIDSSKADVITAVSLIKQMNPIPLNGYGDPVRSYIIPDVIIEYEKNEWTISLNQAFSHRITVSAEYETLMHTRLDAQTKDYCRIQKKTAIALRQCLEQRNRTLLRIAHAILVRQCDFAFGQGELHPMQMKEIAKELNVHESTVSRAVKDKYIQFPRGVFPLRSLFQRSYSRTEYFETAEETVKTAKMVKTAEICSDTVLVASSIKERIRMMIEEEDKKHPLSDQQIADCLKKDGCAISRRTVAKYREAMLIPSTRLRKEG